MKKRALISVSNKEGLVDLATGLNELGWEIVSTGGTYEAIKEAGLPVIKVAEVTGFPEILDGRVKTLHPRIHGGILAKNNEKHRKQLEELGISPIDLVAVNLYPFRETITRPGITLEEAVENIDIGGPAMIRAAAKNFERVIVLVNPQDYQVVLEELRNSGDVSHHLRLKLAKEAFAHTAMYDSVIASYFSGLIEEEFPRTWVWAGEKVYELRYGENPHQKAAFYRSVTAQKGLPQAEQLNGKELSYNNIMDAQAALALVKEFSEPACVIIKHTNPCGTAVGREIKEAYGKAFAADPVSAFGGIVAFNRPLDEETAKQVAEPFLEVIIAPDYQKGALDVLRNKKNLRVLKVEYEDRPELEIRSVEGGFLLQQKDESQPVELTCVTERKPTPEEMKDLMFAWKVVKHVKSNAIVVAKDGMTLGVGAGQMNRVGAAKIALEQAGPKAKGAVLASDAFFPFKDTVELAGEFGITAIIQPGGSVRDEESIEECNKRGIAMVFTGIRHFKH